MIFDFWFTITRGDEDFDAIVEYEAERCFGDVDVNIVSVTIDGVEIETTEDEDKAILEACFSRVDEDFYEQQAAYGDYLYEMRRDGF